MDTKKKRIGVDVDGVLRDWFTALFDVMKKNYPEAIDETAPVTWSLSCIKFPVEYIRYLFSVVHVEEVYELAKPFENALSDFQKLRTFAKLNGYELVCVSHQWDDTIAHTLSWLGKNKFDFDSIVFTEKKYEVDVDVLIDDSAGNYDSWIKHGRTEESFFLFDQEYNQACPAKNRIQSITEVMKYL